MSQKKLIDLVIEVSKGISEIFHHPDYRAIDFKGYESNASLGDAYQAMVDLCAEIDKQEKNMTENNTRSPWLKAAMPTAGGAIAISDELKKEPPEVQVEIRRMDRKTYPETWKALREKEQQQGGEGG